MRRFWNWTMIPAVLLAAPLAVPDKADAGGGLTVSIGSGYYGSGGHSYGNYLHGGGRGYDHGAYTRYRYPTHGRRIYVNPHYRHYAVPRVTHYGYYGYGGGHSVYGGYIGH